MYSVRMTSQPRHCQKPFLAYACSGGCFVTNVNARLMAFPWHKKITTEKIESEQYVEIKSKVRLTTFVSVFSS